MGTFFWTNLAAVAGKYKGDILSAILDFEM